MKKKLLFFLILFSFISLFSAENFRAYEKFNTYKTAGISTGFDYENDDALVDLYLYSTLVFENFGFSLLLPLRILVFDKNDDTDTYFSVLPKRDWDEPRDFLAILTEFNYGHPDEKYYFYYGTFNNFTLGNGTILGHYFNTITSGFPKRSINLHIKTDYIGLKMITDDVISPNIVGGRIYLKPFAFINKESYANNLNLGFSVVYDINIPEELKVSTKNQLKESDKYDNILGVDADFKVWQNLYYSITPKIALNMLSFAGKGVHIGVEQKINIFAINSSLEFEANYILGQSNYSPQYFDTFYDVDKFYFQGNNRKYAYFATKTFENLDLLHGFSLKTNFYLSTYLQITASILEYQRYNFDEKTNTIKENYQNIYTQIYFSPVSFLGTSIIFAKNDIKKGKLFGSNTKWLLRGSIDFYSSKKSLFSLYIANTFLQQTPKTNYPQTKPEDFAYKTHLIFSFGGMATVAF